MKPQNTLLSDFIQMTKPGLVLFVMITVALSYLLAGSGILDPEVLFFLLLGTYLAASGAHVLNQVMERRCDAKMKRTSDRPLCSGRVNPRNAMCLGFVLSIAGPFFLWWKINELTAFFCLLTLLIYLLAYTPLKRYTIWNTWVGALPGAMPAFMGWTAKWNTLSTESWTLFLIVYFWQIPHFLSLAWSYKEDYDRGGFKMLTQFDKSGRITAWQNLIHILFLIEISVIPFFLSQAGIVYLTLSLLLGGGFTYIGIKFFFNPDNYSKKMFFYSIAYLPVLYAGLTVRFFDVSGVGNKIALIFQP